MYKVVCNSCDRASLKVESKKLAPLSYQHTFTCDCCKDVFVLRSVSLVRRCKDTGTYWLVTDLNESRDLIIGEKKERYNFIPSKYQSGSLGSIWG